jgi:hypothetical protein
MSVAHAYANGYSHGNINANCYGYCNSDADSHRYGNGYLYANTSANCYGYCNLYANTSANCYGHRNRHSHSNGYAYRNGNAYGFTNANAVPIAHNGLLSAGGHERCSQHRQGRLYGAIEV